MALDPQIALGFQPPQVQTQIPQPLQQFGQILSLQGLMQQQQLRQMEAANTAAQMQQRQFELDNARKFQGLFQPGQPDPTPSQIYGALGADGTKVVQEMLANRKSDFENQSNHLGRLGGYASTILNDPKGLNDFTYQYNVKQAIANGDIDAATGNEMLKHSIQDPQVQTQLRTFLSNALDVQKQQDYWFKQADDKQKLVKAAADAGQAQQEQNQKDLATASQTIGAVSDKNQLPDWLSKQGPYAKTFYGGLIASGAPLESIKTTVQLGGVPTKPGETIPLPAEVQKQKVEQVAAQGLAAAQAGIRAKEQENTALAGAVLRDPSLYSKLSGDKQAELQPFLARLGFTQFTSKPSDTELNTLYNNQRNLNAVKAMRDDFNAGKYDWITGPVLGNVKHIPYFGDNGKLLEGKLNELRATLGDLVKGGTLRSTDIPIYEKMFPNVTDTTDVIKGKLNSLHTRLEADTSAYRSLLESSGRSLPATAVQAPPAGAGSKLQGPEPQLRPQAAPGAPDVGTVVRGYKYLGGDPAVKENWRKVP